MNKERSILYGKKDEYSYFQVVLGITAILYLLRYVIEKSAFLNHTTWMDTGISVIIWLLYAVLAIYGGYRWIYAMHCKDNLVRAVATAKYVLLLITMAFILWLNHDCFV